MTTAEKFITKNGKVSRRKRFKVNNKVFTSARAFVENETEYIFSQYSLFRVRTGIAINSQETAEQFLQWMSEGNIITSLHEINPINYNGITYLNLKDLLQAVNSTRDKYLNYVNNRGVKIKDNETLELYLVYLEEKKNSKRKNIPLKITFDGVQFRSLKQLINYLGYTVSQYVHYKLTYNKKIEDERGVLEFLQYAKENKIEKLFKDPISFKKKKVEVNRTEEKITFVYKKIFYSSRNKLLEALGYTPRQYSHYTCKTNKKIESEKDIQDFLDYVSKRPKRTERPKRTKRMKYPKKSFRGKEYRSMSKFLESMSITPYQLEKYKREVSSKVETEEELEAFFSFAKGIKKG